MGKCVCGGGCDVVHVYRKEDNGWWRGTVADKTGWFPSNYVQAILHGRLSHLGLECVGEGAGNRRRGVDLDVHRMEDNGWWRGTVADKTGWFPSNYVQAVLHGRLSHLGLDCVGEGAGNRRRGVDLHVHGMEDNGWWRGTVADKTGWFPVIMYRLYCMVGIFSGN